MFVVCTFSELSDVLLLILLKVIYHKLMARARPCKFGLFSHHIPPLNPFTSKILLEPTSNLLPATSLKRSRKEETVGEVPIPEKERSAQAALLQWRWWPLDILRLVIMPCPRRENQHWFFSSVCCWLFCFVLLLFCSSVWAEGQRRFSLSLA